MRKATLEKRKKFLQITEELFYKRGYKETSIKDICEALDTTTGSFYFMFDSKEGILEEIVKKYYDDLLTKVDSILEADGSLKAKLENWIEFRYNYYNDNSEFFVMYDNLYLESGRASLVINECEDRRDSKTLEAVTKLFSNHLKEVGYSKDRLEDLVNIIINIEELRAKSLYAKLREKVTFDIKEEIEFSKKALINLLSL